MDPVEEIQMKAEGSGRGRHTIGRRSQQRKRKWKETETSWVTAGVRSSVLLSPQNNFGEQRDTPCIIFGPITNHDVDNNHL